VKLGGFIVAVGGGHAAGSGLLGLFFGRKRLVYQWRDRDL
jgi:hypothetical protein